MQAAGTDAQRHRAAPAPAPSRLDAVQRRRVDGTAANTAPTSETATQSSSGGSGVQSSQQDASTQQAAAAASSATQEHPENSNISVRVLSPGNDGAVTSRTRPPRRRRHEHGGDDAGHLADGQRLRRAVVDAERRHLAGVGGAVLGQAGPPRELERLGAGPEPGERRRGVAVEQGGRPPRRANTAPVTQTSTQNGTREPRAVARARARPFRRSASRAPSSRPRLRPRRRTSSARRTRTSPIRIASSGGGGSRVQENEAESSASAANTAPVSQTGTQTQSGLPLRVLVRSGRAGDRTVERDRPARRGPLLGQADRRLERERSDPHRLATAAAARCRRRTKRNRPLRHRTPHRCSQTGTQSQTGPGCGCCQVRPCRRSDSRVRSASSPWASPRQSRSEPRTRAGRSASRASGNDGSVSQENEAESSASAHEQRSSHPERDPDAGRQRRAGARSGLVDLAGGIRSVGREAASRRSTVRVRRSVVRQFGRPGPDRE